MSTISTPVEVGCTVTVRSKSLTDARSVAAAVAGALSGALAVSDAIASKTTAEPQKDARP